MNDLHLEISPHSGLFEVISWEHGYRQSISVGNTVDQALRDAASYFGRVVCLQLGPNAPGRI